MSNLSLVQYDEFKAKIDEVKETCNFIPDVSTKEGYEKSKRVALDVGKVLTSLEKSRKTLKADALEFGRKVDGEAKAIAVELEGFQGPHKEAYKALDSEKKERENARKAELQQRVDNIRELPQLMQDADSESVKLALAEMNNEECLGFYEFSEQALKARNSARIALADMFAKKLRQEKDAAELEELRKSQAIQAQKDHDAAVAKEAADKAKAESADREAALQAEKDKVKADAEEAEQRAKDQAERAAAELKAAEKLAKDQAEAAERAKAEAAAKAEAGAKAAVQAEKDRVEAEAAELKRQEEAREANKRHVGQIRKKAKEALMSSGLTEDQAKNVVLAIHNNKIPGVSISY